MNLKPCFLTKNNKEDSMKVNRQTMGSSRKNRTLGLEDILSEYTIITIIVMCAFSVDKADCVNFSHQDSLATFLHYRLL